MATNLRPGLKNVCGFTLRVAYSRKNNLTNLAPRSTSGEET